MKLKMVFQINATTKTLRKFTKNKKVLQEQSFWFVEIFTSLISNLWHNIGKKHALEKNTTYVNYFLVCNFTKFLLNIKMHQLIFFPTGKIELDVLEESNGIRQICRPKELLVFLLKPCSSYNFLISRTFFGC